MKYDYKLSPEKHYPWFLYDPLGNGFEYFKSESERDKAVEYVVSTYCDEGWNDEVNSVVVGKVTGQATQVNTIKPGEPGWDDAIQNCSLPDPAYICDYSIKPLDYEPAQQD